MRILVTSVVDLRKTAHNRLHQFVKHLSQNHQITVISINDWWKASQVDVNLYAEGVKDILTNINIEYLTQRRIRPVFQEVASGIIIGGILEKLDYKRFDVHFNYSSLVSGYFVARKMKSIGVNAVYDIADDLPHRIRRSPQFTRRLRPVGKAIGRLMLKRNCEIATKITFITKALADSYKLPQNKSELIPNGVDSELFRFCSSQPLRQKLGIDANFVIGFVGTLREWVDLEPVFAAVRQLSEKQPTIKILIVGEEGGIGKIEELARVYGISEKVTFTGTVPYVQVPEYISCMDVCMLPLKESVDCRNSLALTLFEHMSCGKPVISTKLDGVVDAVQDRVLYATNEKQWEHEILELYNSKELREKLGADGRKFVEKNYTWSGAALRLEKVLEEVKVPSKT